MKQLVSIGESTWMIPMTWSLFQSGAHMALRMPWKRMESPAPKRGSTMASEVRIDTRSLMTRSAIVFEMVIFPSGRARLRCLTTMGTSFGPALLAQHQEAAVGGDVVEDDVHDLLQHLLHRAHRDQGLRDLRSAPSGSGWTSRSPDVAGALRPSRAGAGVASAAVSAPRAASTARRRCG